jgi:hypothetical protein
MARKAQYPMARSKGAAQAAMGWVSMYPVGRKVAQQDDPHVAAGGKKFTVGEIDELDDTVDHGVAQGNERVEAAQGHAR